MSSSVQIGHKKKDTLILGKGPTQGLDNIDSTMLTAEAQYLIILSRSNRKFCWSFHYNGGNSLFFLMLQKCISLQNIAKGSEIKKLSLYFFQ